MHHLCILQHPAGLLSPGMPSYFCCTPPVYGTGSLSLSCLFLLTPPSVHFVTLHCSPALLPGGFLPPWFCPYLPLTYCLLAIPTDSRGVCTWRIRACVSISPAVGAGSCYVLLYLHFICAIVCARAVPRGIANMWTAWRVLYLEAVCLCPEEREGGGGKEEEASWRRLSPILPVSTCLLLQFSLLSCVLGSAITFVSSLLFSGYKMPPILLSSPIFLLLTCLFCRVPPLCCSTSAGFCLCRLCLPSFVGRAWVSFLLPVYFLPTQYSLFVSVHHHFLQMPMPGMLLYCCVFLEGGLAVCRALLEAHHGGFTMPASCAVSSPGSLESYSCLSLERTGRRACLGLFSYRLQTVSTTYGSGPWQREAVFFFRRDREGGRCLAVISWGEEGGRLSPVCAITISLYRFLDSFGGCPQ